MDRAALIAWASPPCSVCGEPVQRVEMAHEAAAYTAPPVGEPWRVRAFTVCANGHRVEVLP